MTPSLPSHDSDVLQQVQRLRFSENLPYQFFKVEIRFGALISEDYVVATPALLYHKEQSPQHPISCISLVLYNIRKGGFHELKGSITSAGVSNIMISPIIDCFCLRTAITVSLYDCLTCAVSTLTWYWRARTERGAPVWRLHTRRELSSEPESNRPAPTSRQVTRLVWPCSDSLFIIWLKSCQSGLVQV